MGKLAECVPSCQLTLPNCQTPKGAPSPSNQTRNSADSPVASESVAGSTVTTTPGGVSIVGDGGPIDLTQTPGVPEIVVRNIPLGRDVTIDKAHILYLDTGAPAVSVSDNAGSVRFVRLTVTPTDHMLLGTTAQAMVEVERTPFASGGRKRRKKSGVQHSDPAKIPITWPQACWRGLPPSM